MRIVSTLLSLPGVLCPGWSADVAGVKTADSPACHPAGSKQQPVCCVSLVNRSAVTPEDVSDFSFRHRLSELTVPLAFGLLRLCVKDRSEEREAHAVIDFALTGERLSTRLTAILRMACCLDSVASLSTLDLCLSTTSVPSVVRRYQTDPTAEFARRGRESDRAPWRSTLFSLHRRGRSDG